MKEADKEILRETLLLRDGTCCLCKMDPWPMINYGSSEYAVRRKRGKYYNICAYHEQMLKVSKVLKYALKGYLSEQRNPVIVWKRK